MRKLRFEPRPRYRDLTMAESKQAIALANFPSTIRLANLVGYNLQQWKGVASTREHVIGCGWRLASFVVHSLSVPGSCKLGISTLTVKQFSPIAHFAILPTRLFSYRFRTLYSIPYGS
jgi:hypothetical protein